MVVKYLPAGSIHAPSNQYMHTCACVSLCAYLTRRPQEYRPIKTLFPTVKIKNNRKRRSSSLKFRDCVVRMSKRNDAQSKSFLRSKNFPKLRDAQEKKGKELETHQIYNYSFVSASTRFFVVSFNIKSLVISRFVTFWWRLLLLLRLKRRC